MIRSYLGYIEEVEMISRRLTKIQKAEIIEAYKAGDNTNLIAEKYNCRVKDILLWNDMKTTKIVTGKRLTIYVNADYE